eukprot:ANDGO_02010.mRNA.1 tRNA (guanosine(18)-2'-O)-methyltransferase
MDLASEEYFRVVDPNTGRFTSEILPRSAVHGPGRASLSFRPWHRVIHLAMFFKDRILLQQRALCKSRFPGEFDVSVAGHVSVEDTVLDAVVRECQEELGISIQASRLVLMRSDLIIESEDEFTSLYYYPLEDIEYDSAGGISKIDGQDVILQASEVACVTLASVAEALRHVLVSRFSSSLQCMYLFTQQFSNVSSLLCEMMGMIHYRDREMLPHIPFCDKEHYEMVDLPVVKCDGKWLSLAIARAISCNVPVRTPLVAPADSFAQEMYCMACSVSTRMHLAAQGSISGRSIMMHHQFLRGLRTPRANLLTLDHVMTMVADAAGSVRIKLVSELLVPFLRFENLKLSFHKHELFFRSLDSGELLDIVSLLNTGLAEFPVDWLFDLVQSDVLRGVALPERESNLILKRARAVLMDLVAPVNSIASEFCVAWDGLESYNLDVVVPSAARVGLFLRHCSFKLASALFMRSSRHPSPSLSKACLRTLLACSSTEISPLMLPSTSDHDRKNFLNCVNSVVFVESVLATDQKVAEAFLTFLSSLMQAGASIEVRDAIVKNFLQLKRGGTFRCSLAIMLKAVQVLEPTFDVLLGVADLCVQCAPTTPMFLYMSFQACAIRIFVNRKCWEALAGLFSRLPLAVLFHEDFHRRFIQPHRHCLQDVLHLCVPDGNWTTSILFSLVDPSAEGMQGWHEQFVPSLFPQTDFDWKLVQSIPNPPPLFRYLQSQKSAFSTALIAHGRAVRSWDRDSWIHDVDSVSKPWVGKDVPIFERCKAILYFFCGGVISQSWMKQEVERCLCLSITRSTKDILAAEPLIRFFMLLMKNPRTLALLIHVLQDILPPATLLALTLNTTEHFFEPEFLENKGLHVAHAYLNEPFTDCVRDSGFLRASVHCAWIRRLMHDESYAMDTLSALHSLPNDMWSEKQALITHTKFSYLTALGWTILYGFQSSESRRCEIFHLCLQLSKSKMQQTVRFLLERCAIRVCCLSPAADMTPLQLLCNTWKESATTLVSEIPSHIVSWIVIVVTVIGVVAQSAKNATASDLDCLQFLLRKLAAASGFGHHAVRFCAQLGLVRLHRVIIGTSPFAPVFSRELHEMCEDFSLNARPPNTVDSTMEEYFPTNTPLLCPLLLFSLYSSPFEKAPPVNAVSPSEAIGTSVRFLMNLQTSFSAKVNVADLQTFMSDARYLAVSQSPIAVDGIMFQTLRWDQLAVLQVPISSVVPYRYEFELFPHPLQMELLHCVPANSVQTIDDGSSRLNIQMKGTEDSAKASIADDVVSSQSHSRHPLIICASFLDRIPNIAGLMRTSEVFGAELVTIHNRKILDSQDFTSVAVTAHKWQPIQEVKSYDVIPFLMEKKALGYRIVALEQTPESQRLGEYMWAQKSVLVLGREREGLPYDVIASGVVDDYVEIEQFGLIRSLNVHVAASIASYQYVSSR